MATIAPEGDAPLIAIRRRERREPSARSLLLTLLGEYVLPSGEPAWTATLVRALALLGVAEKAARQALSRASAEGWIASRRHGRLAQWELTGAGRRLLTEGAERIYSFGLRDSGWDGRWLVLVTGVPEAGRDQRNRLRTRLTWAGFGALPGGVWISPDPGREAEAARILAELGLAEGAMSFVASYGTIGSPEQVAGRAWDLRAVEAAYREFLAAFARLDPATDAQTLRAQAMLVHEWRRFPFLDPGLPPGLLPAGWPGPDAAALFRDRHDRWHAGAARCWAVLTGA